MINHAAWWGAMMACLWTSFRAIQRADAAAHRLTVAQAALASCNPAGSIILARLVAKIDQYRRFAPDAGIDVTASHRYSVGDRLFLLTAKEITKNG